MGGYTPHRSHRQGQPLSAYYSAPQGSSESFLGTDAHKPFLLRSTIGVVPYKSTGYAF